MDHIGVLEIAYDLADRIDLTDRSHPHIEHSLNIPGLIVGGDANDASTVYTIDYRWDGSNWYNEFDVVSLGSEHAELEAHVRLDGWAGSDSVRARISVELVDDPSSDTPASAGRAAADAEQAVGERPGEQEQTNNLKEEPDEHDPA